MRKYINLFTFIFMTTLTMHLSGQSFIGAFEVIEDNSKVFIDNGPNDIEVDTKTIILKYQSSATETAILSFMQTNNLHSIGEYTGYYVYKLPSNISYINFCQALEQNPVVSYIEPSVYFEYTSATFIPNDPDIDDQYYLDLLQVYEAWNLTTGDSNVIVAVLDSGLEFNEEEFGPDVTSVSNLFSNTLEEEWDPWYDPTEGDGINNDGNGYWEVFYDYNQGQWDSIFHPYIDDRIGYDIYQDEDIRDNDVRPEQDNNFTVCQGGTDDRLHGTWVAGIIAAKTNNDEEIAGIAGGDAVNNKSGISILPIKVGGYVEETGGCYSAYGGTSTQLLEAVVYAHSMGADIINISLAVFSYQANFNSLEDNINAIYNNGNGPLFVASAGNSPSSQVKYPARWSSVVAVGATDDDDDYWTSSSYGPDLELMAPGVDIPVIFGGEHDGTSFSAPMVCATAALMLSVNPDLSSTQIRAILRETAYKNTDYNFNYNSNNFGNAMGWHERFGFGRINTYEAVCMALGYYGDITIGNNEIWDSPKISKNNIYIEDGHTLTLISTLSMDPNKKIVIEPGGQFIIDGGTITNMPYCSGDSLKWKGIEVWGDTSKSQRLENGAYHQGYLELKNGATIENAQTAILLGKAGDYNGSGGGIVKAYDSYFTNNAKSVHFLPYKNNIIIVNDTFEGNNEAFFRNCEFTINESYFPDSQFYKHADLVKVKKIRFYACDFKRESNNATSLYCSGIESYNGGLSIHKYYNDSCTFEGLYTGIVITDNNSTVDYDSYIQHAVFTNNSKGIKLNGMTNLVSIRENTFHVGYNAPDKGICAGSQGYGIFLDNSNTFVIEDNTFDKYTNAPSDGDYIGIEAYNTQTASDEIVGNTFDGLTHANHTTNQNWWLQTNTGVAYYCNIHTNNDNDLFFTWEGSQTNHDNSGVKAQQGSIFKSAGNHFSQTITPGSGYQIYNNTNHLVGYYCYYDGQNQTPEYPTVYHTLGVSRHPQNIQSVCDGGGINPKGLTDTEKGALENEYNINESDYNNVKSLYQSLEDGGNTEGLNTEVSTSWPNDMWELRAELLGLSPYLSTEILKTAADKTDVLPESVLFEILSANPDELKKMDLMNYLENKEQPLPEYMISILKQMAQGQTAKTILQGDMSRYYRGKSRAALQMLVSLQFDEVFDYIEYRLWLNKLGGINSDRKIVASFIAEGNISDALILANLFPELYNLEGNTLTEHNYYIEMLNLDITLLQESRSPMQLETDEYAMLQQIAEDSKETAGVKARGILEHFYGEHFCNCVNTTVDENKSSPATISSNQYAEAMGLKIKAEPNPATTWVAFDYELPLANDNAQLIIRNTEGKQIVLFQISDKIGQEVWDTRSLKSGAYIYEFISEELRQTGKVVIIK